MREFDHLDQLRLSDPAEAGRQAHHALKTEPDLRPYEKARLCGVYAAAMRATARLNEAEEVLREGFRYAKAVKNNILLADLHRRWSILLAEKGNPSGAEVHSLRAIFLFEISSQSLGVAKCLVDLAKWQFDRQDYDEVIESLERALELLPEEERVYRYGALVGRGLTFRRLGNMPKAFESLRRASAYRHSAGDTLEASRLWALGEISADLGRLESAEAAFRCLLTFYLQSEMWIDAVSAAVELASALVGQRKQREIVRLVPTITRLIAPLKGNPIVQKYAIELTCLCSASSTLSIGELNTLSRRIKRRKQRN